MDEIIVGGLPEHSICIETEADIEPASPKTMTESSSKFSLQLMLRLFTNKKNFIKNCYIEWRKPAVHQSLIKLCFVNSFSTHKFLTPNPSIKSFIPLKIYYHHKRKFVIMFNWIKHRLVRLQHTLKYTKEMKFFDNIKVENQIILNLLQFSVFLFRNHYHNPLLLVPCIDLQKP